MKKSSNVCEGFNSIHHQTQKLRASNQVKLEIAGIIAHIFENHIGDYPNPAWEMNVNEGSVTLILNNEDLRLVITIFIDYDNHLANKFNLTIHPDPYAVAIDFSSMPILIKEGLRDKLIVMYPGTYMDPRKNNPKVIIMPNNDTCYDIVFLQQGSCETKSALTHEILRTIEEKMKHNIIE